MNLYASPTVAGTFLGGGRIAMNNRQHPRLYNVYITDNKQIIHLPFLNFCCCDHGEV